MPPGKPFFDPTFGLGDTLSGLGKQVSSFGQTAAKTQTAPSPTKAAYQAPTTYPSYPAPQPAPEPSYSPPSGWEGSWEGGLPPTAPKAPAPPPAPSPPPVPAAPNYNDIAQKYVNMYDYRLGNSDLGTAGYAAGASRINDRINQFEADQRDPARQAFAKYMQQAGLTQAARGLYREGAVNETVKSAPVDTTETVTIPDAYADPEFIQAKAALEAQTGDFKNQQALGANQYRKGFKNNLQDLGWEGGQFNKDQTALEGGGWNKENMNNQYGSSWQNNTADFATRGGLYSGDYADSLNNLNSNFNQRKTQADSGLTDYLDTQAREFGSFQNKQKEAENSALQSAIQAIMGQFGVGASQVGRGSTKTITRQIGK